MVRWRDLIVYCMDGYGEKWSDVVSYVPEDGKWLDYLFDDHNLFPPVARYLSKANVMGRMLTNMGVISAVLQMLQSNELGPEIRPLTKELLQATSEALSSLIYDEEQLGRPLVTPVQHLQELQKLISTIN